MHVKTYVYMLLKYFNDKYIYILITNFTYSFNKKKSTLKILDFGIILYIFYNVQCHNKCVLRIIHHVIY